MRQKWINNKTIIITGASSGIGKQLAKQLIIKNNCKVIGIARNEQKFKNFVLELGEYAKNFTYYLFDVSKEENWVNFANSLTEPIDLLINNAGIFNGFVNFLDTKVQSGKQVIDTNFYSAVYGCNYLLPRLNVGVVNICSSDALLSIAGTSYYSASKGAIKSFSMALIAEYPTKYISCILPGFTDTEIFRDVNFNNKEAKLIKIFISNCTKISNKIYKSILHKKRYKVIGYDAKLFNILSKLSNVGSVKLINGILNKTKLDVFKNSVKKEL